MKKLDGYGAGKGKYWGDPKFNAACNMSFVDLYNDDGSIDSIFPYPLSKYSKDPTKKVRREPAKGSIYFIECGEFIKIGFSATVEYRLSSLQSGNPFRLRLLGSFPGTMADETKLHREFKSARHENEWFRKTPELLGKIGELLPGE